MKTVFALVSLIAYTKATFDAEFVRDLMSEKFIREGQKNADGVFHCSPGFCGSDCSQRTCPYSVSFTSAKRSEVLFTPSQGRIWDESKVTDTGKAGAVMMHKGTFENNHAYKECGSRGTCDRATGQCKCFASFTGEGCQRTVCPNECSGHGTCSTDFHNLYGLPGIQQVTKEGENTQGRFWSAKKFASCNCDRGYSGFDCSLRTCPQGDDPETECSNEVYHDKQKVTCTFASPPDTTKGASAYFSLHFRDHSGGKYRTRPIRVMEQKSQDHGMTNKNAIQDALEALPNFAIPTVEIDYNGTVSSASKWSKFEFNVNFVDAATTNEQASLWVDTTTACADSSQPKFASSGITCTVSRIALSAGQVLKENKECGGRGLCDTSTGLCSCFEGYYGDSCSMISTYV